MARQVTIRKHHKSLREAYPGLLRYRRSRITALSRSNGNNAKSAIFRATGGPKWLGEESGRNWLHLARVETDGIQVAGDSCLIGVARESPYLDTIIL